jgi:hypothetical protein
MGNISKITIVITILVYFAAVFMARKPNHDGQYHQQNSANGIPLTSATSENDKTQCQSGYTDEKTPAGDASTKWPEWGLFGVGVITLGVIAFQAYWTRRAAEATQIAAEGTNNSVIEVRKQVALMERQTEATEKAATAARDSVETVINKERARVRINLKELSLMPRQASIYFVEFTVTVDGYTPAYITETRYVADTYPLQVIGEPDNGIAAFLPFHNFPEVIPPNTEPIEQEGIFHYTADDAADTMQEIKLDRLFVEIRGVIKYKDVFARERETCFRKVWRFNRVIPPGHPLRSGEWEKCGSEEDNRET